MHLGMSRSQAVTLSLMVACIVLLPLMLYPVFLMKVMCYALFACAFNLVLGYAGLLPFGHAAFFGTGAYIGAWTAKALMPRPSSPSSAVGPRGEFSEWPSASSRSDARGWISR
jgi:ABC-type branched-subunit amino acid transport system permease subunit